MRAFVARLMGTEIFSRANQSTWCRDFKQQGASRRKHRPHEHAASVSGLSTSGEWLWNAW